MKAAELTIQHGRSKLEFVLAGSAQSYLSWYTDTAHDAMPLLSGYRAVLVYDLAVMQASIRILPRPS